MLFERDMDVVLAPKERHLETPSLSFTQSADLVTLSFVIKAETGPNPHPVLDDPSFSLVTSVAP